jgi:hypothetical protein
MPDMDRNEESRTANTISPGPPYAESVSFNQSDSSVNVWKLISIEILAGMPDGCPEAANPNEEV